MESFHLPFTAVITLAICLTSLAVTMTKPSNWLEPRLVSDGLDQALTTECDRLVMRYLMTDHPSFEELVAATQKFMGDQAFPMLLRSVDDSFAFGAPIRRDRLYLLRGRVLTKMGRSSEAIENFKASLRWNPDDRETRKSLIHRYLDDQHHELARVEIEKALDRETSDRELEYYKGLLERVRPHLQKVVM